MTDILITGGSGFLGRKLIKKFTELGFSYISLNSQIGDINNLDTFKYLPKVKFVFHLAAKSSVPKSWSENEKYLQTNVLGTKNVVDYSKKVNAKFIMASSYIYGNPEKLPICEKHPVRPNNPYALSKFLAEQIVEFESNQHNINSCILRIFNIFGNGQNENFLIPQIINQIKNKDCITVLDTKPKRDFIFIDDVVDAFLKSMNLDKGFYRFNIGSGISYSVEEIIAIIQKILGTKLPVYSLGKTRINEIFNVIADISLAKEVLNWTPKYSFKEGMLNYLDF